MENSQSEQISNADWKTHFLAMAGMRHDGTTTAEPPRKLNALKELRALTFRVWRKCGTPVSFDFYTYTTDSITCYIWTSEPVQQRIVNSHSGTIEAQIKWLQGILDDCIPLIDPYKYDPFSATDEDVTLPEDDPEDNLPF